MNTDRNILAQGLKFMGLTLILMFVGPTLLYIGFSNEDKPLYIPILIVGFLICIGAVYFAFKGLRTIMNSIFKKP